jgi:hypothetical protein
MTTELPSQQNSLIDTLVFLDHNRIHPEHVVLAIDELLARAKQSKRSVRRSRNQSVCCLVLPTWEDTMDRGNNCVSLPLLMSR